MEPFSNIEQGQLLILYEMILEELIGFAITELNTPPAVAKDLALDTLVIAVDRWDTFYGESKRRTWIYGILRNLVRTWRRSKKRSIPTISKANKEIANVASDRIDDLPDHGMTSVETHLELQTHVKELPGALQKPCTLHWLEGLTPAEAVAVLGVSKDYIRKLLERGRKSLRKTLAKDDLIIPPREKQQENKTTLQECQ